MRLAISNRLWLERCRLREWTFAQWTNFWMWAAVMVMALDVIYAVLRRR